MAGRLQDYSNSHSKHTKIEQFRIECFNEIQSSGTVYGTNGRLREYTCVRIIRSNERKYNLMSAWTTIWSAINTWLAGIRKKNIHSGLESTNKSLNLSTLCHTDSDQLNMVIHVNEMQIIYTVASSLLQECGMTYYNVTYVHASDSDWRCWQAGPDLRAARLWRLQCNLWQNT